MRVTIIFEGRRHEIDYVEGDTVLDTARRAGLSPKTSCEAGNCATCIAVVREGDVTMRVNDALDDDEVADGWILTCQSIPATDSDLTVDYEIT